MKIGLLNIDSVKIPNLALEKIRKFHIDRGDSVGYVNHFEKYDKVYKSKIFTFSQDNHTQIMADEIFIGGSGYNISSTLPKEIYDIRPHINIDFATRGCIRKCSFCIVPQKEGMIRAERDLYDIWDGKSKMVTFLDNNILALPDHFELICTQVKKEKIVADFNQGLDIRLITDRSAKLISTIRQKEIRFALDDNSTIPMFDRKLKILRKYLPKHRFFVYVLVGFNTTLEQDLERMIFLKENDCRPYVMRYESCKNNRNYTDLAAWGNQHNFFMRMDFKDFQHKRHNRNLQTQNQLFN